MSHGTCPVVSIVAPVTDDNPLGYVVINESDFDPEIHKKSDQSPDPEPSSPALDPDEMTKIKPVWEK